MLAKAVAHHTASFIRVVGSEFVQKYWEKDPEWSEMFLGLPGKMLQVCSEQNYQNPREFTQFFSNYFY